MLPKGANRTVLRSCGVSSCSVSCVVTATLLMGLEARAVIVGSVGA